MIKLRDLRGMLATDIEMRNLAETNISQHEVTLTDLESRQVIRIITSHQKQSVYCIRPSRCSVCTPRAG